MQEGVERYNEVYGICPDQVVTDPRWHKAGDLRWGHHAGQHHC